MKLSVIIVSYNVTYFLEQCLHSVRAANAGIEMEVFVVDNSSVDGSVKMVREKFPEVHCIANQNNPGFAVANNQAIKLAKGEYALLLNPDTIVETDTFTKIIAFMDSHPDAGGLGVKMVDGTGKFLPESKRGLPTPIVAFYKIFGLSRIFPKSKIFNKYHLGFLDENQTHQVDILAGAFMLLRMKALDKVGLLDETFFMYGEDIDLSYRILKGGFKNYYYPEARIIHYKGESTKKGSLNYVFVFYNAMIIFAQKHFSTKNAKLFSFLINLAIYFRATLSVFSRVLSKSILPLIDATFLYSGLAMIARIWEQKVIYPWGGHYPTEVYLFALPILVFVWLFSVYFSGGYDKPISLWRSYRGIFAGAIGVLVIYALLPEHLRFSRILIIAGTILSLATISISRVMLHIFKVKGYSLISDKAKRFAIIGGNNEVQRVSALLNKVLVKPGFIGIISNKKREEEHQDFLGTIEQIEDIILIHQIDELIFCAKDMPAEQIIDQMAALQHTQVEYKIAPPESLSIIGSNSINTAGDLYVIDINSIGKHQNRRSKRMFDLASSLFLIISYPITAFFITHPFQYLQNILLIFFGKRSVTGFYPHESHEHKMPEIRQGIIYPTDVLKSKSLDNETIERLNMMYARDYKISNEFRLLYMGFKFLGRKT